MRLYVLTIVGAMVLLSGSSRPVTAGWQSHIIGLIPENHMIRSVAVVDENVVWAVSDTFVNFVPYAPTVVRTTDGGASWTGGTAPGTSGFHVIDIFSVDRSTAWICGMDAVFGSGFVFKTTDGGTTWEQKLADRDRLWVAFFDAQNGVVVSWGDAWTTTDGGETWTGAPQPPQHSSTSFYSGNNSRAVVGNTIWTVDGPGQLQRSEDRGYHWSTVAGPFPTFALFSVAFEDADNGLACTYSGGNYVARTTDGGDHWTRMPVPFSSALAFSITSIPGISGGYMMVGGNGSAYTLDAGTTWNLVDGASHYAVDFHDPPVGWTGQGSYLCSWAGAMGIIEAPVASPGFELKQNHPNPFNPTTTIRFVLPEARPVRLAVYDALGREVEILREGTETAGVHSVSFEGRDLPAGVYFYRLESGRSTETRSMLLVR